MLRSLSALTLCWIPTNWRKLCGKHSITSQHFPGGTRHLINTATASRTSAQELALRWWNSMTRVLRYMSLQLIGRSTWCSTRYLTVLVLTILSYVSELPTSASRKYRCLRFASVTPSPIWLLPLGLCRCGLGIVMVDCWATDHSQIYRLLWIRGATWSLNHLSRSPIWSTRAFTIPMLHTIK